jgi:hypothetical protein
MLNQFTIPQRTPETSLLKNRTHNKRNVQHNLATFIRELLQFPDKIIYVLILFDLVRVED